MRPRELAFYVNPLDPYLADRLAWLRDQGIRLIGTDGMGGRDAEQVRRISAVIEKAGMRVVSAHAVPGLMPANEAAVSSLRAAHLAALDGAALLGAEHVVLHFRMATLPWHEGVWWEEAALISQIGLDAYDARVAETVCWLCEEASRRKLTIALENMTSHYQFGYRVDEIVAMVQRVDAPNLGICLDTGHAHGSGLNVPKAVRTAGRYLSTVHLHDNFGGGDPRQPLPKIDRHLAPGLGTIDWPATIRALDAAGYQGPAVFEGVQIGSKCPNPDRGVWESAITTTIANWRVFERLAAEM